MDNQLFRALAWIGLVLAMSVLVGQIIFIRLSWNLTEAQLSNAGMRHELETMKTEFAQFRRDSAEHRVMRCQMLMMMTAARSGWYKAQRLLQDDMLDVCVQQETGQWKLPPTE